MNYPGKIALDNLYNEVNQSYHPIIDYIVSLQIADKLSDTKNIEYYARKLIASYSISMENIDTAGDGFAFLLNGLENKVDIEAFLYSTKTKPIFKLTEREFIEKLIEMGFNINNSLTTIHSTSKYFYISLNDVPTVEQVMELRDMII